MSPAGRQDTQQLTLILPKQLLPSKQPPYSAKEAVKHVQVAHSYSSDKNDSRKVGLKAEHVGAHVCVCIGRLEVRYLLLSFLILPFQRVCQ